jgi:diacylglycerol kinase family enzyme
VIYNPAAGRGRARRLFDRLKLRFPDCTFRPTAGRWDAVELASKAVAEGFGRVVAAGGDGTVHEVANGVLQSENREVIFAVWPVGSSNDYAFSLGMKHWWADHSRQPLDTMLVDVGVVRAPGRERFFVNGCGVGFNGMVTLESERIRWLRGLPLYAFAFLRAMAFRFATPPLTVGLDTDVRAVNTLALSLNLGQREGGFPITLAARLDDGQLDFVHVGGLRRWELARYLPGLVAGKLPIGHPHLRTGRCATASVTADAPLCVHTDGEFFCRPEDGVTELRVELLSRRLRVEVCPAFVYGVRKQNGRGEPGRSGIGNSNG